MAKISNTASSPDYQLKHRVAGAIIVVSVAVLVIPLLLSPPDLASSKQANAQQQVNSDKKSFRAALETSVSPESSSNAQSALLTSEQQPSSDNVRPTEVAGKGSWFVRVGTFSKQPNIASALAALNQHTFHAKQTRITTKLGERATRIWLGPYAQRETAERVNKRVQKLLGNAGLVTQHTP